LEFAFPVRLLQSEGEYGDEDDDDEGLEREEFFGFSGKTYIDFSQQEHVTAL